MAITEKQVRDALSSLIDPNTQKDFVSGKSVKSVKVEGDRISVEIVLGYGGFHKRPGILNKLIRFDTFHNALQYLSYALAGIPYMGVGRNLSYKRALFFDNKGFSSINQKPLF